MLSLGPNQEILQHVVLDHELLQTFLQFSHELLNLMLPHTDLHPVSAVSSVPRADLPASNAPHVEALTSQHDGALLTIQ